MKKILLSILLLLVVVPSEGAVAAPLLDKKVTEEKIDCSTIDSETEVELLEIVSLFQKEKLEAAKERLNQQVLTSPNDLKKEQSKLKMYPCIDGEKAEQDTTQMLEIYQSMLTYYEKLLKEEEKLHIEELTLDPPDRPYAYNLNGTLEDGRKVQVVYFPGAMANSNYYDMENELRQEVIDMLSITNIHYIKAVLIDPLVDLVFNNPLGKAFDTVEEYYQGKADLAWEIEVKSALIAVGVLGMEFSLVEGDIGKRQDSFREVLLFPRNYTYDVLERWKEVHTINPEIPYPEEEIQQENWIEIGEIKLKSNMEMDEIDPYIYHYISDGTLPEGRTAEEVAKGIKNGD